MSPCDWLIFGRLHDILPAIAYLSIPKTFDLVTGVSLDRVKSSDRAA
ncbi:MAG TPA: hypothetical protein V6C85_01150 [Allocoleopsis sp.]